MRARNPNRHERLSLLRHCVCVCSRVYKTRKTSSFAIRECVSQSVRAGVCNTHTAKRARHSVVVVCKVCARNPNRHERLSLITLYLERGSTERRKRCTDIKTETATRQVFCRRGAAFVVQWHTLKREKDVVGCSGGTDTHKRRACVCKARTHSRHTHWASGRMWVSCKACAFVLAT
jgi:hypothetical protein